MYFESLDLIISHCSLDFDFLCRSSARIFSRLHCSSVLLNQGDSSREYIVLLILKQCHTFVPFLRVKCHHQIHRVQYYKFPLRNLNLRPLMLRNTNLITLKNSNFIFQI